MVEINKFYNCDCMQLMKELPDKFIDLAIVDPPYGIGESGGKNHSRGCLAKSKQYEDYSGNDKEPPSEEYFAELMRVSKNQIIFGANHYISRIPYDSSCWIVWDKDNGSTDFADCELAWTSFPSAVRKFKYRWQGMLQEDMRNKEERIHPNQKPVALYEWLLRKYAKQGDIILDTHCGSASSLIACHRQGFDYIGCELHEGYYELATERLEAEKAQIRLF